MSMVTASAELDLTPGNNTAIVTQIYVFITTQCDGTLLDPTSFREEDVIELCVGLGQEHLKGVLQASDTETIIAFPSSPSMTAALQPFVAAMTWHDEPIWLCIWPP